MQSPQSPDRFFPPDPSQISFVFRPQVSPLPQRSRHVIMQPTARSAVFSSISEQIVDLLRVVQPLVSPVLPREQASLHAFMHCIHPNRVAFHFTWSITLHRKIQTCILSISQSSAEKKNHSEGKCRRISLIYPPRSPKLLVES